jgi:hypothetical protein
MGKPWENHGKMLIRAMEKLWKNCEKIVKKLWKNCGKIFRLRPEKPDQDGPQGPFIFPRTVF